MINVEIDEPEKMLQIKNMVVYTCRMPRTYFTASSAEKTLNKPSQARIINLKWRKNIVDRNSLQIEQIFVYKPAPIYKARQMETKPLFLLFMRS